MKLNVIDQQVNFFEAEELLFEFLELTLKNLLTCNKNTWNVAHDG